MVLVRTRPRSQRRISAPAATSSLMREMETLFREFAGERPSAVDRSVFPAVNVTQDADRFYLRAELPGMDASNLDLSVDQNKVTIRGGRNIPDEDAEVSFHRRERASGSFARTVTLPVDIDHDGVTADYRHGLLTVTVPKAPEVKPRQITVKSS